PYCGAAVLTTSSHCGNCGRPVPPAPQGPGQAAPAKTIFGYQAPRNPGAGPGLGGPRSPTPAAGAPAGLPTPQRQPAPPPAGGGCGQQNPPPGGASLGAAAVAREASAPSRAAHRPQQDVLAV